MIATPTPAPTLSAVAARLGLHTVADVWAAYHAQQEGWNGENRHDYPPGPQGARWHCPLCDTEYVSVSGARKHMQGHAHPVLRTDWLEDGWLAWVSQQRQARQREHQSA